MQKSRKNINIVKYFCNLKYQFSVLIHFKIECIYVMQRWIYSIITYICGPPSPDVQTTTLQIFRCVDVFIRVQSRNVSLNHSRFRPPSLIWRWVCLANRWSRQRFSVSGEFITLNEVTTEDSSHKTEACLHSLSRRSYLSTVEHNTKCYAKYLSFSFGFNEVFRV